MSEQNNNQKPKNGRDIIAKLQEALEKLREEMKESVEKGLRQMQPQVFPLQDRRFHFYWSWSNIHPLWIVRTGIENVNIRYLIRKTITTTERTNINLTLA